MLRSSRTQNRAKQGAGASLVHVRSALEAGFRGFRCIGSGSVGDDDDAIVILWIMGV